MPIKDYRRNVGGKSTGTNQFVKSQAVTKYIAKYKDNEEHWQDMSHKISRDRGCDVDSDSIPSSIEAWAADASIQKRGIFVPWPVYCMQPRRGRTHLKAKVADLDKTSLLAIV